MNQATFNMRNAFLFLALVPALGALMNSCSSGAHKENTQEEAFEGYDDFMVFYDRFHRDSAFQMEHILFPLEGIPAFSDSTAETDGKFRWQKEDWELHKPFDPNSGFERSFLPIIDGLIVERMTHASGAYGVERRWALMQGEWFLIYYAATNREEG